MVRVAILLALCGCDALFEITKPSAASSDAAIPDGSGGPIALYLMDELGSASACMHDTIGGRDGACIAGLPTIISGRHGNAYKFDGTSYITVPGIAEPTPTPPFTITVWLEILHVLTETHSCPINRVYATGGADSWQSCLSSGLIYFGGGTTQFSGDGTSMALNTWHHVALTYDGNTLVGWLDGTSVGSAAATVFFDTQPLALGADLDGGALSASYLDGIDELAIYDRVLDDATIQMLSQM